jgi:ribosomal protein L24
MAAKIKKGDKVVVISGSDKGKTGEVRHGRSFP